MAINDHFYSKISDRKAAELFEANNWRGVENLLPDVKKYIENVSSIAFRYTEDDGDDFSSVFDDDDNGWEVTV